MRCAIGDPDDWKPTEPSSQTETANSRLAGTSMRRPADDVPSSTTSRTASTAAIQNERR